MKKIVIAFLCLLVLFAVSCAAQEEEIVPTFDFSEGTIDFSGYNFRIVQDDVVENTLHYEQDTLFYDLLHKRLDDLEKNYNCTIGISQYGSKGSAVYAQTQIVSGIHFADFFYGGAENCQISMGQGGLLIPFEDLTDNINYRDAEKFGGLNLLECTMVNGKVYGVIPAKWPNKLTQGNINAFIAFNEDVIKRYQMPNPRELYEDGGWTMDNFTVITPDFYVKDGENEVMAMMTHPSNFARAFLGASGMKLVSKVGNEWRPCFETDNILHVIEWAQDYATINGPYVSFLNVYSAYENLIRGETAMCITETMFVDSIAKEFANFGLLPFPAADGVKNGDQITYFSIAETFSIFSNTPEPDACAILLNALLEPFEGYETEEQLNDILYKTMFYNEKDVEYYANISDSAVYQYYSITGYQFLETIAEQFTTKSASEIIGSLEGTMDEIIEKYIAPNYEFMYGETAG